MNKCKGCETLTHNKKFCSRSCAGRDNMSRWNAIRSEKSKKDRICPKCRGYKYYKATQCLGCKRIEETERQMNTTLKAFTHNNGNTRVKWAHVRKLARNWMIQAGRLAKCEECEFTARVEVCHIRPIADFSPDALVGEVNAQDNMMALCPNHHTLYEMALSSR